MDPTDKQKVVVAALCITYGKDNVTHHRPDKTGRIRCELRAMAGVHIWYVCPDGYIDVSAGMAQTLFDAPAQPKPPGNAQAN